jgi:hypothetical protein
MNRYRVSCVLAAGVFVGFAGAEPPPGPAGDVPELQPLNHWAGRWDTAMTIKPNADLPSGASVKGTATGEWIHGGRFLRQTWAVTPGAGFPPLSGSTVMTYDPRQRAYRSWSFISTGFALENRGTWDAKARTMTWTGQDTQSGRTMITRATFADGGTETWSIVEKDKDGQVVSESTGRNTRRKD